MSAGFVAFAFIRTFHPSVRYLHNALLRKIGGAVRANGSRHGAAARSRRRPGPRPVRSPAAPDRSSPQRGPAAHAARRARKRRVCAEPRLLERERQSQEQRDLAFDAGARSVAIRRRLNDQFIRCGGVRAPAARPRPGAGAHRRRAGGSSDAVSGPHRRHGAGCAGPRGAGGDGRDHRPCHAAASQRYQRRSPFSEPGAGRLRASPSRCRDSPPTATRPCASPRDRAFR